jgi:hypothetical protein
MKNFTTLIMLLLTGFGLMAGNPQVQSAYIPYHQQVNLPLGLNPGNTAKQNSNTRSLQWELLAEREDIYDDSTSAWLFLILFSWFTPRREQ